MKTATNRLPLGVYVLNANLLLCHEIDAAYQQEWKLYRLPGGPDGFVALHIVLIGFVLWGLILVERGSDSWRWFSLLLGLAGVGGGMVHAAFLVAGSELVSTLFSMGLIVAFIVTSILQVVVTLVWWNALEGPHFNRRAVSKKMESTPELGEPSKRVTP